MLALIIDDEKKSRELLRGMLQEYCTEVSTIREAEDVKSAVKIIEQETPNVVFLDIEMPEENGFKLFKHFPSFSFEVIFVTAYNEHALQAFEYAAIDYILKPISIERLVRSVKRAASRFPVPTTPPPPTQPKINPNNRLAIPTLNGFRIISLQEILYCQAERNYTLVFLEGGEKLMVSKNLGKFERLLDPSLFLRIHRSFIVSFNKIKQFRKGKTPIIILSDDIKLEVSANKKDELLKRLQIID